MAVARTSAGPAPRAEVEQVWPDRVQVARCIDSLVVDGLLVPVDDGLALPA
jgi:A/G-specific adenine glycosylase